MLLPRFKGKYNIQVGCDEAGRGCLSGPVVAAAVLLPKRFNNSDLNDSKKLSKVKRYSLRETILDKAVSYGVFHYNLNRLLVIHIHINMINIIILGTLFETWQYY